MSNRDDTPIIEGNGKGEPLEPTPPPEVLQRKLQIKLGVTPDGGHVFLHFGDGPVQWFAVAPEEAVQLALAIIAKAREVDPHVGDPSRTPGGLHLL